MNFTKLSLLFTLIISLAFHITIQSVEGSRLNFDFAYLTKQFLIIESQTYLKLLFFSVFAFHHEQSIMMQLYLLIIEFEVFIDLYEL